MTEADGVYAELSAFGVLSQNLHHEEYDINVGSFFFFAPSSFLPFVFPSYTFHSSGIIFVCFLTHFYTLFLIQWSATPY